MSSPLVRPGAPPLRDDTSSTILQRQRKRVNKLNILRIEETNNEKDTYMFVDAFPSSGVLEFMMIL